MRLGQIPVWVPARESDRIRAKLIHESTFFSVLNSGMKKEKTIYDLPDDVVQLIVTQLYYHEDVFSLSLTCTWLYRVYDSLSWTSVCIGGLYADPTYPISKEFFTTKGFSGNVDEMFLHIRTELGREYDTFFQLVNCAQKYPKLSTRLGQVKFLYFFPILLSGDENVRDCLSTPWRCAHYDTFSLVTHDLDTTCSMPQFTQEIVNMIKKLLTSVERLHIYHHWMGHGLDVRHPSPSLSKFRRKLLLVPCVPPQSHLFTFHVFSTC